jgi:hypothetical protein
MFALCKIIHTTFPYVKRIDFSRTAQEVLVVEKL